MPTPLVTQHYPDDFQIMYELLASPANGTIVLYADRDLVIDAIYVGVAVAGGASSTVKFAKSTSGTATSPASAAPGTITSGATDLTGTQAITATGTFTPTLLTTSSDTNLIKAGNYLGIILAGTVGTPTLNVTIRFRSRVA